MAVPVFEASGITNVTSNATTVEVNKPSGLADQEVAIILVALDGNAANPNMNGETGWNRIVLNSEGAVEIFAFWKVITDAASEPTTWTMDWTGGQQGRFMSLRISGARQTDPIDVEGTGSANSASTTNQTNAITSSEANTLAIAFVGVDRDRIDNADGLSDAQGFTETGVSNSSGGANGAGLIAARKDLPSAGGSGNPTFGTWASDQSIAVIFNVREVAGGPQNFERTASQTLTHSSVTVREGSTFNRTGTTVLTHIDSIASNVGFVRTASQILTHIDSAIREGSTFTRAVAQLLTHITSVIRAASTFSRTVVQTLTHADVAVSDAVSVEVVTTRPKVSARKPLQPLAPEIIEERLTVFLKITLYKQELVSSTITNTIHLKLHQRESLTTKLQAPEQWLAKDHIKSALILTLKQKDKLFSTFWVKLRESLKPSQEAQIRLKTARTIQVLRDSLADKDKRIIKLADHILKLNANKELQAEQLERLQTALEKLKAGTMSADDVLALFATSN